MKRAFWAIGFAFAVGASALAGSSAQLPPRDEGVADADFTAFRETFLEAVRRKDKDAVLATAAPDIKFSFGEDGGREAFAKNFGLDDPGSLFWNAMETVLGLGAKRDDDGSGFWMPYVYAAWPEDYDAFEYVVAVKENAALRDAPRPDANIVRTLNYDIVQTDFTAEERTGESGEPEFLAVIMADGSKGFVARGDVRSPIDYRAHFVRRDGKWVLDVFVAGD